MQLDFTNRRILVTGASKGIGAATARTLGSGGATVGVHYNSDQEGAQSVAGDIAGAGGKAIIVQGDLCDRDTCREVVEQFVNEAGGVDALVNNAGALLARQPAEEYDPDAFLRTFQLNVTSAFLCTRAAIPHLRQAERACIVFLSSVATRFGPPGVIAYAGAKTALNGMTMSLARELAPDGIRVNAVAPGVIDTPFHANTPRERLEQLSEMILLGRLGTAQEIANVIAFLVSDAASYITGECIDVNGGMWLRA